MEEPDGSDDDGCLKGYADEGVGPAAMVLKAGDGAIDGPEGIDVWEFCGDDHCDGGIGGFAIEAGPGEASSGHEVRDRFHCV